MKIIFIVLDGLGDQPIPQFKGKTPLEAAKTPNLDFMAKEGVCGVMTSIFRGAIPTSEEGHFTLFGYNPMKYPIRRGYFAAMGLKAKMKSGDVVLRGDFATVDKKGKLVDRRAGRIKDTRRLILALQRKIKKIKGVKIIIKRGAEYRLVVILRGKGLSWKISDSDLFYSDLKVRIGKVKPLDRSKEARFTAEVLNEFLEQAHNILKDHPLNKKREREGKLPANFITTRGASTPMRLPSFKEKYGLRACFIAGKPLYKGIARTLGMKEIKVKGDTGLLNTNLKGKFKAAKEKIKECDFIFLHIKATDSLAEDGNFLGKKKFIEKIDKEIKILFSIDDALIVVTADHSTCSLLKRHCKRPYPLLIYGNGQDKVKKFSEKTCPRGAVGKISAIKIMPLLLKIKKSCEKNLSY